MHVRTLGISQITVGENAIGTERPSLFALLFMLAMAHPRPVARAQLAISLWPIAQPRERNHRLRTLLYRARRTGAPLVACESGVALSHKPIIDFRDYATRPGSLEDVRTRLSTIGVVLPGLDALSCAGIVEMFEDARDTIVATVVQWLRLSLLLARSGGDWPLVARLARTSRELDAHDHAALQWLVEAECITTGRRQALRTLDEYLARVQVDETSRRSALALRRRIVSECSASTDAPPLVGRAALMQRIWIALARAERGHGGALLLWGPAGVGKTRLLSELEALDLAAGARVLRLTTRPSHGFQPLGLVRDLAARLLEEPGAAGCEPAAFQRLRRFISLEDAGEPAHGESVEAMFAAVTELLAALTDEAPLLISIDDLHVADLGALPFWRAALRWSENRRLLWVFAFRALSEAELADLPDRMLLRRLPVGPLDRMAAMELLVALDAETSTDSRERTLNTSSGYPLLLRAATEPFDGALGAHAEAAVDDTITRLNPCAAAALRAILSLGVDACRENLASHVDMDPRELARAILELEQAGMIYESNGALMAYDTWAHAVLERVDLLGSVL